MFTRGQNLCKAGHCWWLRKALYGTRMASQMWGETVRAVMDSGGWHCLQSIPNAFYLPVDGHREDDSSSVCHGDDFLAEGSERNLDELDELLNEHFEVTVGERDRARETRTGQIPQEDNWVHRKSPGQTEVPVSSGLQIPSMLTSWCNGRRSEVESPQ